jgi:glycosyltransferase involved in cell wall biosynthesis
MKAGVPIITTTVGNIPELIDNGVEGILCAPNDKESFRNAIVSTGTERELWEKRTAAAIEKAEQFTLSASLEAFEKVLKDICA